LIADADTLMKKRGVELQVMKWRLKCERSLKEPIDDEYGVDCINAMIAAIEAEYAAKGLNAGFAIPIAGIVGDDSEENDSDYGQRSKRYVCVMYIYK
jgi:UDP-N-acetylmuramyl pentapeptide synthase